ncbi:hypothetical protein JD844_025485 [Phrynosoma platyrhinos]|uniref:Protein canopy homolog 3 n=1 Tax=Phrynosoma platyrhinos TaxID=52577 RepID=A0ABQ7SZK2_PHRPL|nr:hypothetical protein JD844_025485 [Phrynosoma platyrhinos]
MAAQSVSRSGQRARRRRRSPPTKANPKRTEPSRFSNKELGKNACFPPQPIGTLMTRLMLLNVRIGLVSPPSRVPFTEKAIRKGLHLNKKHQGTYLSINNEYLSVHSNCSASYLSPVCKYVALELKSSFDETGKTKEVIDTKYGFLDGKASKIKYTKSDIRLIEVTENICKRLLEYNLHKERSGSNRFAKVVKSWDSSVIRIGLGSGFVRQGGMSETFETLHNLVHKGVKVVMDIPYELWNETSAEVADLKKQCEVMVEEYEDVIEDWYRNHQEEDISQFLCANHVLKGKDTSCLTEKWTGKKGDLASSGQKKAKKKESKGKKSDKSKKSRKDEVEQERETMNPSASEGPDRAEEEEVVQKAAPLLHNTDEL